MKPSSPWSVKGVEPEAREAAKMAARRAGLPLGTWLSQTIRRAASEELRSGAPPRQPGAGAYGTTDPSPPGFGYGPPPGAQHGPNHGMHPGTQADPQAGFGQPGYGAHGGHQVPPQPPAPTTQAVLESINNLAARIKESEKRTAESLVPLAEKVRDLSEQMESVKESQALDSNPIERALSRMQERIDQMEDGGRPSGDGRPDNRPGSRRKQGFFSRLFSD